MKRMFALVLLSFVSLGTEWVYATPSDNRSMSCSRVLKGDNDFRAAERHARETLYELFKSRPVDFRNTQLWGLFYCHYCTGISKAAPNKNGAIQCEGCPSPKSEDSPVFLPVVQGSGNPYMVPEAFRFELGKNSYVPPQSVECANCKTHYAPTLVNGKIDEVSCPSCGVKMLEGGLNTKFDPFGESLSGIPRYVWEEANRAGLNLLIGPREMIPRDVLARSRQASAVRNLPQTPGVVNYNSPPPPPPPPQLSVAVPTLPVQPFRVQAPELRRAESGGRLKAVVRSGAFRTAALGLAVASSVGAGASYYLASPFAPVVADIEAKMIVVSLFKTEQDFLKAASGFHTDYQQRVLTKVEGQGIVDENGSSISDTEFDSLSADYDVAISSYWIQVEIHGAERFQHSFQVSAQFYEQVHVGQKVEVQFGENLLDADIE